MTPRATKPTSPWLPSDATRPVIFPMTSTGRKIISDPKRIEYYEMLHRGLWQVIFQPDATDEIEKEKIYIEELEQMLHELRLSE